MKSDHHHNGLSNRLASGAAGGLAGAMALHGLRMASKRVFPETVPPMTSNPDDYLVMNVERRLPKSIAYAIPTIVDIIAAKLLALGYGAVSGALCSVLPKRGSTLLRGACLGLFTWAVGYVGWLPRAGLMPPLKKQRPAQIAGPIVRHIMFGMITIGVSNLLQRKSCD
jgi:hypothetical protein